MGIFDVPDPPPIEEQPLPVPTGLNAEEDARRFMAIEFDGQRCYMCEQVFSKDKFSSFSTWCAHCRSSGDSALVIADQLSEARIRGYAIKREKRKRKCTF